MKKIKRFIDTLHVKLLVWHQRNFANLAGDFDEEEEKEPEIH